MEQRFKQLGTIYTLGSSSSAEAAPGDYNGDGKTDPAVFNNGTWTWKASPNPSPTPQTFTLGTTGDKLVSGDYDGDGATDAAVFHPSTGVWSIRQSSDLSTVTHTFGESTDIPVPGDYNRDGTSDLAVYRPSQGMWYIDGQDSVEFGLPGDVPVQSDFDATVRATLLFIVLLTVRGMF